MFITVTCSTYIEACTCLLKPVRINTCLTCPTSHLQRMRSCQLFELRDELKDMEQIVLEIGEALVRIIQLTFPNYAQNVTEKSRDSV